MESLFTWCAVIGGSIFALQFLMLILGLESGNDLHFDTPDLDIPEIDVPEIDVDLDVPDIEAPEANISLKDGDVDFDRPDVFAHSDGWFVGIVTFRSLVAAVAIFGLTGLAAMGHLPPEKAIGLATLSSLGMLYLVGWSFKQLYLLQADGTVHMSDAVGCTGIGYLTIPGESTGAGKVTVKLAERTMEYRAVTKDESLKTGTAVVVTSVISEDTLEVKSQLPSSSYS
ncbi:MAG: hypothetical protein P8M30_20595 [Planctomycetaceae bacterium]|nr:hypothetical protein [Planctomycetaceae bacterium]